MKPDPLRPLAGGRRSRRRPLQDQRFSSYLSFGFPTTICLVIFLAAYMIILLIFAPLLQQEAPTESHIERGQVLKPVLEKVKNLGRNHGMSGSLNKLRSFRENKGLSDADLMKKATEKMLWKRKEHQQEVLRKKQAQREVLAEKAASGKRAGFMVVGMHRSGTSMLSGLMVNGLGYNPGGPLIGGAYDNTKGFFELIPAVLQNDEFMQLQRVWWSANVINYDADKALEDKKSGKATFKNGEAALAFLNDPKNAPYIQKDPRMCITLKTWLPLMNNEPAIIFTYRHPLEVALSLKKREQNFTLEHGLRLWIVYNMRGIQNSKGLCRVFSSNEAVFADPLNEVQRLSDELTTKCGVPAPPQKLSQDAVDKFVDPNLQHNKKNREKSQKAVIADFDGCVVHDFETDAKQDSPQYEQEKSMYLKAMRIFCDLESGKAYNDDYEWPTLP